MSIGTKAVRVRIEGRVQGVWYRGWTVRTAGRLGLHGWVRNLVDGSVEAVFCGPEDQVDVMVTLCRQGPPAASVTALHCTAYEGEDISGFHQR